METIDRTYIFGPGSSLNHKPHLLEKLKDANTVAWSHSMMFFLKNMSYQPSQWWFMDPHSILDGCRFIIDNHIHCKTILVILEPMLNTSLEEQLKYTGAPYNKNCDLNWETDGYDKYLKLLDEVSRYINIKVVKATTTLFKCGYVHKKLPEKLHDPKLLLDIAEDSISDGECCLFTYRGKLMGGMLPMCLYFRAIGDERFKNIFIAGCDGYSGVWHMPSSNTKEKLTIGAYKKNLPVWKQVLLYKDMNIYSISHPSKSVLGDFMEVDRSML